MFQEGIGTTFCVEENCCLAWLLGQGQPCNFKFSRLGAEADEKETRPLAILKDVEFLLKKSLNKTHTIAKIITTAHKGCDSELESAWLELYPQDPPSIAPNIASVTCSVCVKWGALRWRAGTPCVLGNLRPDVSPWAASPWTLEAAKSDSVDALGVTRVAHKTPLAFNSDSYNNKSILGFFPTQIENLIVTHNTVRRFSKPFQSHHESMQANQISKNISLQDSKERIL